MRTILLAVTTRLDEVHNMGFDTVPLMTMQAKKFESNVDPMMAHDVVMMIS
jgi:hypothetical protein